MKVTPPQAKKYFFKRKTCTVDGDILDGWAHSVHAILSTVQVLYQVLS